MGSILTSRVHVHLELQNATFRTRVFVDVISSDECVPVKGSSHVPRLVPL